MKNLKKTIAVGAIVVALGITSVSAYAASTYDSPADAVAGLTGRTVDSVVSEKIETGKTYGTIANEANVLDEFQSEMLEIKKDTIQAKVDAGIMSQDQADSIIQAIEENQINCDGTGTAKLGQKMGAGFGKQNGTFNGKGMGQGNSYKNR